MDEWTPLPRAKDRDEDVGESRRERRPDPAAGRDRYYMFGRVGLGDLEERSSELTVIVIAGIRRFFLARRYSRGRHAARRDWRTPRRARRRCGLQNARSGPVVAEVAWLPGC